MTTTNASTTFLQYGETTQFDGYTLQDAGKVKIGKTTYAIEIQEIDNCETVVWLKGPRGGAYMLEPVNRIVDNGVRRLLSFNSGSFLRVQGNEVRVVMIGDIIEVFNG